MRIRLGSRRSRTRRSQRAARSAPRSGGRIRREVEGRDLISEHLWYDLVSSLRAVDGCGGDLCESKDFISSRPLRVGAHDSATQVRKFGARDFCSPFCAVCNYLERMEEYLFPSGITNQNATHHFVHSNFSLCNKFCMCLPVCLSFKKSGMLPHQLFGLICTIGFHRAFKFCR